MRFFASGFFDKSVSPQPQSIPWRPFRIFSKIRGDIRKSRHTTGINDTGGKFATGVNDTGGKITTGINNIRGKFFHQSLVLLIPVTNLPPGQCQRRRWLIATGINDASGKFAAGVNYTANFRKNSKRPW